MLNNHNMSFQAKFIQNLLCKLCSSFSSKCTKMRFADSTRTWETPECRPVAGLDRGLD